MRDNFVWFAALVFVLCAGAAHAVEIEGVQVEDRAALDNGGPRLVLNGASVRYKMAVIKVYVGALYLTGKKTDADGVLRDPGPKRVAMHVLIDELTARELTASLNNALAANHIPAELALIESRIRDMNRMMNSIGVIKKGGVIHLDYLPGVGTRVTVNGEQKITIKGEDFFQAMLRIWIGRKPVDGRLRDAMLGGGAA
ncbi:MAG: chalcone isomerase family protein [Burkholderiales bacterium]|nr:chalcone isomerase family protein [Burkholderiales bacterium]